MLKGVSVDEAAVPVRRMVDGGGGVFFERFTYYRPGNSARPLRPRPAPARGSTMSHLAMECWSCRACGCGRYRPERGARLCGHGQYGLELQP